MRAPNRAPWRTTFNPEREFVVRRRITVGMTILKPGDAFPKTEVTLRRLRQLYDQRVIHYPGETPGAPLDFARRASGLSADVGGADADGAEPAPEDAEAPSQAPTASAGVAGDQFTSRASVDIPDDWQGLSWPQKRALGALLTDDPVTNKAEAEAAIAAELERRAAEG